MTTYCSDDTCDGCYQDTLWSLYQLLQSRPSRTRSSGDLGGPRALPGHWLQPHLPSDGHARALEERPRPAAAGSRVGLMRGLLGVPERYGFGQVKLARSHETIILNDKSPEQPGTFIPRLLVWGEEHLLLAGPSVCYRPSRSHKSSYFAGAGCW